LNAIYQAQYIAEVGAPQYDANMRVIARDYYAGINRTAELRDLFAREFQSTRIPV
jgi:hypothetical protein